MDMNVEQPSPIDKKSPVPLHYQLKEYLKRQIETGQLKPGQRIPTEEEFCQMYGISRSPVRQALVELERSGWIERFRWKGTFVRKRTQTVTIKVMLSEPEWIHVLREAARRLNEHSPEQQIDLQINIMDYAQLRTQLIASVARGQGPDLFLGDLVWLSEFVGLDFLYPLEELDATWVAEWRNDAYANFIEMNSYRGKLYGLQCIADMSLVWYRKDWFEQEAIAPPQQWQDVVSAARHFQKPEVQSRFGLGPHPLAFAAGQAADESTVYQFSAFVYALGGGFYRDGSIHLGKEVREALQLWVDLVHRDKLVSEKAIHYKLHEISRIFAKEELALAVGGSYERNYIQEATGWSNEAFNKRVGFVPIRFGPNSEPGITAGGVTFGVLRQAQYPLQALELLKQGFQKELINRLLIRNLGHSPIRQSLIDDLGEDQDAFMRETSTLLTSAKPRPALPKYAQISRQLQLMIEHSISRKYSVDEAVDRASEIISAIV